MKAILWKIGLLIIYPSVILALALFFVFINGWLDSSILIFIAFLGTSILVISNINKSLGKAKNEYKERLSEGVFNPKGIFYPIELEQFSEVFIQNKHLKYTLVYNEVSNNIRKELGLLRVSHGFDGGYAEGLCLFVDLKNTYFAGTVISRYTEEYKDRWTYLKDDKIVNCLYFNIGRNQFQWCSQNSEVAEDRILSILIRIDVFLDTYHFDDDAMKFKIRIIGSICSISFPEKDLGIFREISVFSLYSKSGAQKLKNQYHDAQNRIDLFEEGLVKLFKLESKKES